MVKLKKYEECNHIKQDVFDGNCIHCHVTWCHRRIELLELKDKQVEKLLSV